MLLFDNSFNFNFEFIYNTYTQKKKNEHYDISLYVLDNETLVVQTCICEDLKLGSQMANFSRMTCTYFMAAENELFRDIICTQELEHDQFN